MLRREDNQRGWSSVYLSTRGQLRPTSVLALAPLLVAAIFWLGPRYVWNQGWRDSSQFVSRTAPSCAAAEAASHAWVEAFSDPRVDIYASVSWRNSPLTHERFSSLPPMWTSSPNLRVYGNASLDGHKTLVDLEYVMHLKAGKTPTAVVTAVLAAAGPSATPCVVYSFGGNAEVDFEASVLATTTCSVWQFDCTVTPDRMAAAVLQIPAADRGRFFFKPYCVGADGDVATLVYGDDGAKHSTHATLRSVSAIMQELGHTHLNVLKMDVEGAEFVALPDFFATIPRTHLPPQITIELHARGNTVSETFAPVVSILRVGYVLIARRDNLFGSPGCCTELTFALCRDVDEVSHAGALA